MKLTMIAAVLSAASLVVVPIAGQKRLEFEVASIKAPNPTGDRGMNMSTEGDTLRMHNATLRFCVLVAYGVQDYEIDGGPSWIETEKFEIVAKAEKPFGRGELQQMLQALLADRFKLGVRRQTKELSVYHLTVAKGGFKLRAAEPGPNSLGRRGNGGPVVGQRASMEALASLLSTVMRRRVLDQTGLQGVYDFTLEFAPLEAVDSPLPSLTTALQEQLGLKLEAGKGPVEVLTIDRAERPSKD
jgi:uncharacterized protein (TIGR03435 family)